MPGLLICALLAVVPAAGSPDPAASGGHPSILDQARASKDAGRLDEAAMAYADYLQKDPGSHEARFEFAQVLIALKKLDEAEKQLQAAILAAREKAPYWERLGQVYLLKEDLDHAERAFLFARDLDPNDAGVRYNLGKIYETQEQGPDALMEYLAFIELAPDHPRTPGIRLKVAKFFDQSKQPEESLEHYTALVEQFPDKPGLRHLLADSLYRLLRYDEAYDHYKRILGTRAEGASVHFNIGFIAKTRGNLEEAERELTRAHEMDPNDVNTTYHLGAVQFERGNHEAAVASFEHVVAAEPEHPQAHYYLGRALAKLGRREEARAEMEKHQAIALKLKENSSKVPGTMEIPE